MDSSLNEVWIINDSRSRREELIQENVMKVAVMVRVSTIQQTIENQLLELYEVCERNDWSVVEEYNETV